MSCLFKPRSTEQDRKILSSFSAFFSLCLISPLFRKRPVGPSTSLEHCVRTRPQLLRTRVPWPQTTVFQPGVRIVLPSFSLLDIRTVYRRETTSWIEPRKRFDVVDEATSLQFDLAECGILGLTFRCIFWILRVFG